MLTAQATREIVALFARYVSMKRFITSKTYVRAQREVRFEVHVGTQESLYNLGARSNIIKKIVKAIVCYLTRFLDCFFLHVPTFFFRRTRL